MTRRTHAFQRRAAVVGALAVACLTPSLTGCTSPGDAAAEPATSPTTTQASPSPSPTLSEEEALKQANIETAKKLVAAYIPAVDKVENRGSKNWEDLVGFWGGDLRPEMVKQYTDFEKGGGHGTGATVIVSQKVRNYTHDVGHETVRLDVCLDYSDVKAFNADGSPMELSGPRRYVSEYLVQHEHDDFWTIDEIQPHSEQTC